MGELGNFLLGLGVFLGSVVQALNYIKSRANAANIEELTKNTNSMNDALVKVVGEAEHAKGVIQGAEQQAAKG